LREQPRSDWKNVMWQMRSSPLFLSDETGYRKRDTILFYFYVSNRNTLFLILIKQGLKFYTI
jgi:hypothetical protein